RQLAGGVIIHVSRNDGADPAFCLRCEMLDRILEVLETRCKRGFDFRPGDRAYADQQLQLTQQSQRLVVPLQFRQDVVEVAEGERGEANDKFPRFSQREESVRVLSERLAIRQVV